MTLSSPHVRRACRDELEAAAAWANVPLGEVTRAKEVGIVFKAVHEARRGRRSRSRDELSADETTAAASPVRRDRGRGCAHPHLVPVLDAGEAGGHPPPPATSRVSAWRNCSTRAHSRVGGAPRRRRGRDRARRRSPEGSFHRDVKPWNLARRVGTSFPDGLRACKGAAATVLGGRVTSSGPRPPRPG